MPARYLIPGLNLFLSRGLATYCIKVSFLLVSFLDADILVNYGLLLLFFYIQPIPVVLKILFYGEAWYHVHWRMVKSSSIPDAEAFAFHCLGS